MRLVGKDHVQVAVFVNIDESQAGVASLASTTAAPCRQGERQSSPALRRLVIAEYGLLTGVADQAFRLTVAVQVAQPQALISPFARGEKRLAVQFQPRKQRCVGDPGPAIEPPGRRGRLVAQQ